MAGYVVNPSTKFEDPYGYPFLRIFALDKLNVCHISTFGLVDLLI